MSNLGTYTIMVRKHHLVLLFCFIVVICLKYPVSSPTSETNPEKWRKVWPLEWWEIENNTILQLCAMDSWLFIHHLNISWFHWWIRFFSVHRGETNHRNRRIAVGFEFSETSSHSAVHDGKKSSDSSKLISCASSFLTCAGFWLLLLTNLDPSLSSLSVDWSSSERWPQHNTSGKKMSFGVEEWWLAKSLVIMWNHQPPAYVLVYAGFSMPVKCVLRRGGQLCLTASETCWQLDS